MAPRKKVTPKEEVQTDIEDVTPAQWEEAHAINQELDEAIELEQMCNQSDRDFKRYELVKCLVANDSSMSLTHAAVKAREHIKVADIILNELERREDE